MDILAKATVEMSARAEQGGGEAMEYNHGTYQTAIRTTRVARYGLSPKSGRDHQTSVPMSLPWESGARWVRSQGVFRISRSRGLEETDWEGISHGLISLGARRSLPEHTTGTDSKGSWGETHGRYEYKLASGCFKTRHVIDLLAYLARHGGQHCTTLTKLVYAL